MKKFVLGILVLLAVGVTGTLLYADHVAQRVVESGSSRAFGTPVQVGGVRLGLMDASFAMNGYEVSNPGEFQSPYLFGIGSADLDVGYDGLSRERIVADRLVVDGVVLNLEMAGRSTNFGPVLRHLRQLSGAQPDEPEAAGPRFVIRTLELRGIEARLTMPGVDKSVQVPPVKLQDVGGEDGVWMSQLAAIVLGAVLDRAAESGKLPPELAGLIANGLGNLPSNLAREARDRVKEALEEETRGLLDKAADAVTGDDKEEGG